MPTTYTHYRFGKDVLSALPRPLQQAVENKRELYDIGLHGPDILFYYRVLTENPVRSQGYELHDEPANIFFTHAEDIIARSADQAAARAYIYGFICHFALDSECHKYIEKMIQVSGLSHSTLEMEFDRYLLTEDHLDPIRHLSINHIHPTVENAKVIAPFYEDVSPEVMEKVLKSMIQVHKMMYVPNKTKRKFVKNALKLAHHEEIYDMVMSEAPNPGCSDYNLLLRKLYSGAVPLAADLIMKYQKALFKGAELPVRFRENFSHGDHWQELTL